MPAQDYITYDDVKTNNYLSKFQESYLDELIIEANNKIEGLAGNKGVTVDQIKVPVIDDLKKYAIAHISMTICERAVGSLKTYEAEETNRQNRKFYHSLMVEISREMTADRIKGTDANNAVKRALRFGRMYRR